MKSTVIWILVLNLILINYVIMTKSQIVSYIYNDALMTKL